MGIWKRAILYLTRKKSRSVLLMVLIFVMANLILAGNALSISSDKEIEKIRKNLGSSFIVAADTENESLYEEKYDKAYVYKTFTGRTVSTQLIDDIMGVNGVIDYEINAYEQVWSDLRLRPGLWADSRADQYITEEELLVRRKSTIAFICGNGETNVNFRTGAFSVTEGRNILNEDRFKAVISEYVAEKNRLAVGDSIIVETKRGIFEPSEVPSERFGEPVELEVVGIFAANFEQEASVYTAEEEYADNFIFIDRTAGLQLKRNREADQLQEKYGKATFFVDNPEKLEDIMKQVKDSIDLSGLLISQDDSAYKASVKPLKQIGMFSAILMYAGIFGSALILCLMLMLWIKGRRNEIGILLSIGINKLKIVFQFMTESLIVTIIALILTLFLSRTMTDNLFGVAEKMAGAEGKEAAYSLETGYGEAVPAITKVSSDAVELEYSGSGRELLYLAVTACITSCVSVLLASVQIMKMSPKRLLQSN